MLPAAHRLTDGASFRTAVRRGARAGSRTLVLHLAAPSPHGESDRPARVGFVVSKAVGTAVTRNRVKRRLRHLMRARVDRLADGSTLVVRAQPAAAEATSSELARDLDRCLGRVLGASEEAGPA